MGLSACGSAKIDTSDIVGTWYLTGGTVTGWDSENFEILGDAGTYIVLTLDENGTGNFDTSQIDKGSSDVTWKAKSATEGTITIDSSDGTFEISGEEMTVSIIGETINFSRDKPGTSADFAGSTGSAGSIGSAGTSTSGSTVTYGNEYVGYIQEPSTWGDTTNLIDSQTVSDYAAVQFGDPTSEYASSVTGGGAYAKCITMLAYGSSASDVMNNLKSSYESDPSFGEVGTETTTLDGCDVNVIMTTVPNDNLQVIVLIIKASDSTCVGITLDCGTTEDDLDEVLDIAGTWTRP